MHIASDHPFNELVDSICTYTYDSAPILVDLPFGPIDSVLSKCIDLYIISEHPYIGPSVTVEGGLPCQICITL